MTQVDPKVFEVIQANGLLVSRVKTFKEIFLDFLAVESSVYHFDLKDSITSLYGHPTDPAFPAVIGRRLANLCITLREHPCIRYQKSSKFASEVAATLHQTIVQFKRSNPSFVCHGEDAHHDRDRGQILILDRSFDPVSPLMHEYTYQAMANDLLEVDDGVISYTTTTNKNAVVEKQAILNESDEIWLELRHQHIAKVIETIKERMSDIIQNNSGAQLAKANGADLDITAMANAVKKLPEYTQTMSKLSQHVSIAQQCMDAFARLGLLTISQTEQTISTGYDEDGKECKGTKLTQLVMDTLRTPNMGKDQKIRLLAIYLVVIRNSTSEEFQQLCQTARLTPSELQSILNFERMLGPLQQSSLGDKAKGGIFSFFKKAEKMKPTAEGEYTDTRHVCQLKVLLEQLISSELPTEKFPAMGPAVSATSEAKNAAKSARKVGANTRWAKKDNSSFSGGRYLVFIAGGITFSEQRVGYELSQQHSKEVISGSTHLLTPDNYLVDIGSLGQTISAPKTNHLTV